jgi:hypothetical protein
MNIAASFTEAPGTAAQASTPHELPTTDVILALLPEEELAWDAATFCIMSVFLCEQNPVDRRSHCHPAGSVHTA